jgi:hypothetical protein
MDRILAAAVAIVLGLLALGTVGYAAHQAFSQNTVSNVTQGVAFIVTNARSQFTQSSNAYANFTTAQTSNMVTAGIFPAKWVNGGAVVDPWGNPATMAPTGTGNTEAELTIGGGGSETPSQCEGVVQSLQDYTSLTVGGQTFSQTNTPDPTTAAQACAGTPTLQIVFQ